MNFAWTSETYNIVRGKFASLTPSKEFCTHIRDVENRKRKFRVSDARVKCVHNSHKKFLHAHTILHIRILTIIGNRRVTVFLIKADSFLLSFTGF